MKNKKYRILVLSDLGGSTYNILQNTARLANMIGAEIGLFHVKQPSEVVKQDNQLSAIRSINASFISTKKEIEEFVRPISEIYDQKITASFSVGNVKEEILKQIQEFHPDVVVMGQKKQLPFKLLGDSITQYVLSNFDGTVMIASHDQLLQTNQELTLGMFNGSGESLQTTLAEELLARTNKPLKSFKIVNAEKIPVPMRSISNNKVVEYNFEQGDGVINTMSKYLSKTKVDVLFVNREDNTSVNTKIKDVIGKFNVPMLLAGDTKINYHNTQNA